MKSHLDKYIRQKSWERYTDFTVWAGGIWNHVIGVAKSRTGLSDFHFHSHSLHNCEVSFLVKTVPWFPMKFGVNPYSTSWPTRTLISLFRTSPIYGHGQSLSYLILPSHCCCHLIKILKLFLCLFLSEYFCLPFLLSGSFPFALYIRHVWWLYARCPDLEFLEFLLVCGSGLALNTRYILREIWKVEVKQSHFKLSEW